MGVRGNWMAVEDRIDGVITDGGAGERELVEALLGATPVLVRVAARSADEAGEVTFAQYRVLALLSSAGPHRIADLAEALSVTSPNATRICARLARKHLVRRSRSTADRRAVRVSLTSQGRELVELVGTRRRSEFGRIVAAMSPTGRDRLQGALDEFMTVAQGMIHEPAGTAP